MNDLLVRTKKDVCIIFALHYTKLTQLFSSKDNSGARIVLRDGRIRFLMG